MKVTTHRKILEKILEMFETNPDLFHEDLESIVLKTGHEASAAVEFQEKYKISPKTPFEMNLVHSLEILSEIRSRQFKELNNVDDLTVREITTIFRTKWNECIQELKVKSENNIKRLKTELIEYYDNVI